MLVLLCVFNFILDDHQTKYKALLYFVWCSFIVSMLQATKELLSTFISKYGSFAFVLIIYESESADIIE